MKNNQECKADEKIAKYNNVDPQSLAEAKRVIKLDPHAMPFVVLPTGKNGELQPVPVGVFEGPKQHGSVYTRDMESFCLYVNAFKEEYSRIFYSISAREFICIIDYHDPEENYGHHCKHNVSLKIDYSYELSRWLNKADTAILQGEFADFLEDRYIDVIDPVGAQILEIAKTFEMKPNVTYKSAQRQSDGGYNLVYMDDSVARGGVQGNMEVPAYLTLKLPVFEGGPSQELKVRLLYKLREGVLTFGLRFLGLDNIVREAFTDMAAEISTTLELPMHNGHCKGIVL